LTTRVEREVLALPVPEKTPTTPGGPSLVRLFLSADGRTIVYGRGTIGVSGGHQISRVDVDGSNRRGLYDSPTRATVQLLGFSRDGRSVLFQEGPRIMSVPLDGGQAQTTEMTIPNPLPYAPGGAIPFLFLSPDQTRIAIGNWHWRAESAAIENIPALLRAPKR
jgi:hypothetical protein